MFPAHAMLAKNKGGDAMFLQDYEPAWAEVEGFKSSSPGADESARVSQIFPSAKDERRADHARA